MTNLSSYVYQHSNGVFYFRRAIPTAIRQQHATRPDIRVSLRTRDPKTALALARQYAVQCDELFTQVTEKMDLFKKKSVRDLVGKLDFVVTTADGHKIELNNIKAGEEQAAEALLQKSLNMLSGQPKAEKHTKQDNQLSIGKAIHEFLYNSIDSTTWSQNNKRYYMLRLTAMGAFIGKCTFEEFNEEVYIKALNELSHLPERQNRKEFSGLNPLEMVAAVKKMQASGEEINTIGDETFNKYISTLNTFFVWANSKGYCSCSFINKGMRKCTESDKDKRDAFTREQVTKINNELLETKHKIKPWQFFIPLIAMYSGARQAEIAQLDTTDIVQENGIHGMKICETAGSDKSVKNRSSIRFVPFHPEILKHGILEYQKDRVMHKKEKLFFDEKRDYGDTVNKWFNRTFMDKMAFENRSKLGFHSFRHTFITELMNIPNNNDRTLLTIQHIVGHTTESTSTNTYLKHITADNKLKLISLLNYQKF
ncbi:site-specific integrase [Vogesella sp. DC21W]|uniref:Site-specific integrase n=1 Tax=Vogesella aquatica TaxID=2984206 RepID=A0ABT5IZL4_9NEIS|nr:site-specific integrase [Vogesella aquatica]MDC7717588.1 site-specific integrase [Vogesella aquatica]